MATALYLIMIAPVAGRGTAARSQGAGLTPGEPLDARETWFHGLQRSQSIDDVTDPVSVEAARRIVLEDVVMTPARADDELARYAFRIPGQATACFNGYSKPMELKGWTEPRLGGNFDLEACHRLVLAQGLLPPASLSRALREEFVPARLAGG
jgi:hypothetical protein